MRKWALSPIFIFKLMEADDTADLWQREMKPHVSWI